MSAFHCALCGKSEIRMEGDGFVCLGCGCRYSREDAQKLFTQQSGVGEPVNPFGNAAPPEAPENKDALLERAELFLEQGDFARAWEYTDRALDRDPRDAKAYLIRLLCETGTRKAEDLETLGAPFDASQNFQMILRFGDDALKNALMECNEKIRSRNAEELARAREAQIREEAAHRKEVYENALADMAKGELADLKRAEAAFASLSGLFDADEKRAKCLEVLEGAKKEKKKKRKKVRRIVLWTTLPVLILTVGAFLFFKFALPEIKYSNAVKLYRNGKYQEARDAFKELIEDDPYIPSLFSSAVSILNSEAGYRFDALADISWAYDTKDGYKNSESFLNSIRTGSLRETTVDADGKKTSKSNEYILDKDGKLLRYVKEYSYTYESEEYEYDEEGRLLRITHYEQEKGYAFNKAESEKTVTEYKYDGKGKPEKAVSYDKDGKISSVTTYSYDKKGRVIKEETVNSDGSLYSVLEYEYDKNGTLREDTYTYYNNDGERSSCYSYQYDASGHLTKYKCVRNGKTEELIKISYDKAGRPVKRTCTEDNQKGSASFRYDKKGRLTKVVADNPEGGTGTIDLRYDGKGNCVECVIGYEPDSGNDKTITIQCEYDTKGNCTERVTTSSNGDETVETMTYGSNGKLTGREEITESYTHVWEFDKNGIAIKHTSTDRTTGKKSVTTYEGIVFYVTPTAFPVEK